MIAGATPSALTASFLSRCAHKKPQGAEAGEALPIVSGLFLQQTAEPAAARPAPLRVKAQARIGMLVELRAVEAGERIGVCREVRTNPVEDNVDPVLVQRVNRPSPAAPAESPPRVPECWAGDTRLGSPGYRASTVRCRLPALPTRPRHNHYGRAFWLRMRPVWRESVLTISRGNRWQARQYPPVRTLH